jgi:hypothetical protein
MLNKLQEQINYDGRIDLAVYTAFVRENYNHVMLRSSLPSRKEVEDSLVFIVNNKELSSITKLLLNYEKYRSRASTDRFHGNRLRLATDFRKIFAPKKSVSIKLFLENEALVEQAIKAGYAAHLERLMRVKEFLTEKHREQAKSLKDILGI